MKMKETLQIGKQNSQCVGTYQQKEVRIPKEWEEADVYGQRQAKNEGEPSFVLHDGPPC